MENETVYILKKIGRVNINLKNIIDKKGISRGKLSKMIAMNYDLVNRYYNNRVTRVDLEVLARMCYVLNCNISDILVFDENGKETENEDKKSN